MSTSESICHPVGNMVRMCHTVPLSSGTNLTNTLFVLFEVSFPDESREYTEPASGSVNLNTTPAVGLALDGS